MKTKIVVSKSYDTEKNAGVEVGIVTGYLNNNHTYEYQVFELNKPIQNVGLIGVDNKDEFAITFKPNFTGRFAMAVYLDGVNTSQSNGITNINQIEESKRDNYYSHNQKFICENENEGVAYLYRFSQKNEENRLFTFTTSFKSGINEILISDPSLDNRIEIYLWKEKRFEYSDDMNFSPPFIIDKLPKTKVGAGEATNNKYKNSPGLNNPLYLGKAMFIHLNSGNINHLGQTKIATANVENFNFKDPMDLVPKT